jgi:hypothetical protein
MWFRQIGEARSPEIVEAQVFEIQTKHFATRFLKRKPQNARAEAVEYDTENHDRFEREFQRGLEET